MSNWMMRAAEIHLNILYEELHRLLTRSMQTVPAGSNTYKALQYIRPFTVGRKNWGNVDSIRGAEASAIMYSLVETAKANGFRFY